MPRYDTNAWQCIGEMIRHLASPAAKWVSGTAVQLTGGYQRGVSWF